jgi:biotin carboxyl carrier protein
VTVDLELDGTRCRVTLRRAGNGWIAGIDGREAGVSVVEAGGGGRWSMLVGTASYEIAFDRAPGGELIVLVNGVAVPLTVIEPGPAFAPAGRWRGKPSMPWAKAARGGDDSGPRTVVAPMPGRIVKVLVIPEEVVAAGQPLVVVEAMKMENEVRAPHAGTVAEVRVAEGASVEANTVLVVLR